MTLLIEKAGFGYKSALACNFHSLVNMNMNVLANVRRYDARPVKKKPIWISFHNPIFYIGLSCMDKKEPFAYVKKQTKTKHSCLKAKYNEMRHVG